MPPHVKNERARLERRREKVLADLAAKDSELVKELRAIDAGLAALASETAEIYLRIRSPKLAIRAALERAGKPLTRREIVEDLYHGGFPMDAEKGRQLMGDSIRLNLSRGHFVQNPDETISLPEWDSQ